MQFNSKLSTILHIDLNSCFATIEQQANPLLRGKPIAVAAYTTPNGCILAPSIEAKRFGVKTGMRVKDGQALCPGLIILSPDPWKYRNVHLSLRQLISNYTADFMPKSIDEFVLNMDGYLDLKQRKKSLNGYPEFPPCRSYVAKGFVDGTQTGISGSEILKPASQGGEQVWHNNSSIVEIAKEIKQRIKTEIGDWLTVSIGISTNRFLAKLASGLHKPDGLDEINCNNFLECFGNITLTDLPYIKLRNAVRLNSVGIYSVMDFYTAPLWKLKAAFQSINSYYWYLRLHGFEIDDIAWDRRSYGNSYALPKPVESHKEASPILAKLVEKMSMRLRLAGYSARGVHLAITFRGGGFWHKGLTFSEELFATSDIYRKAYNLFLQVPLGQPIGNIAVSVFSLVKNKTLQLNIFKDMNKKRRVAKAVDKINTRWGNFVISSAQMVGTSGYVVDRIAFGGVKELEEFTLT